MKYESTLLYLSKNKAVLITSVIALLLTLTVGNFAIAHAEDGVNMQAQGGVRGPRPQMIGSERANIERVAPKPGEGPENRMERMGERMDAKASTTLNRIDDRMMRRDDRASSTDMRREMRASSTEMRRDMRASSTDERRDDRMEKREMRIDERVQKRCDEIGKRIDNRVGEYAKNHDEHVAMYKANRDRLANLLNKLESNGKDVTTLKADLVTLDAKIKVFADLRAEYIGSLNNTKAIPCGKKIENASSSAEVSASSSVTATYTGEYKAGLNAAKVEQDKVQAAAKDIANFIKNTIVKDVKALQIDIRANASSSTR